MSITPIRKMSSSLALSALLVTAQVLGAATASQLDASFTNSPQFHQRSWPTRVTSGPSGKVYVTFSNGSYLSGVNNQRRGAVIRFNADGTLDASFNVGPHFAALWALIEQANGQVLVGGLDANESEESGLPLYRVFRVNADGTRDLGYRSPVFTGIPRYMTLQSDGKLLVSNHGGTANGGLEGLQRLNSDGSLDTSFSPPVLGPAGAVVFSNILVDPSGRILIGGTFGSVAGQSRPGIARLNGDGTLDNTFVPSGFTFGTTGQVRGIALQASGKVVIAGGPLRTTGATGSTLNRPLLRLNSDGSLDTSFILVQNADAGVISTRPRLLAVLPNDKLLVVSSGVARFNADGSVDATYTRPVFSLEAFWMDALADGRVYVPLSAGSTVNGATPAQQVMRFNADGTADTAFAPGTFQREIYPEDLTAFPDGRFLAWGEFDTVNATARVGAARFNADGTLDPGYSLGGVSNFLGVLGAGVLSDGRLLAAIKTGTDPAFSFNTTIARFGSSGALDTSFNPDASIASAQAEDGFGLRVLPDDKALVWSLTPQRVIDGTVLFKRLNVDGTLDSSFAGLSGANAQFGAVYRDAVGAISSITVGAFRILGRYPDGRLIAAATKGPYAQNAASLEFTLLRFNADGTLDGTFVAPSVAMPTSQSFTATVPQYSFTSVAGLPFSGVSPQSDGGVIVHGTFNTLGGQPAPGIARLTSTGAVDPGFSVGSGAELRRAPGRSPRVMHFTTDARGKYWVSGLFDTFGGQAAPGLARLNKDGSLDPTFSSPVSYRSYLGGRTRIVFDAAARPMLLGTYQPGADGFPDAIHRLPAPMAPSSLIAAGPARLQSSGRAVLTAAATYTDGTSRAVSASWTSSDATLATVSPIGVLSAGSVTADTPVTLTASYSEDGVTVSASRTVIISAAPAELAGIAVSGSSSVQSGGQVLFKLTATYSDGSSRQVSAGGWTLSNAALGSVNSRGVLTVGTVTTDTLLTVTASYTEGGITRGASSSLSISAAPAVLSSLTLIGAQGTVAAGKTLNLAAEGRYSDGSRKRVNATWQVSGTAASISASGVLTAASVAQDTPVLITAAYSERGVSVSTEYQTLILATVSATPDFQAEVEVAGTRSAYSMSLWFNAAAVSALNQAGGFAATETYKVYVAAVVPAGPLLSVPTAFLLDRSSQWQALSFPMPEYLSGVVQNDWQLIELIAGLDISLISGTLLYVGYGTSDTEMISAGRYRIVYQTP